MQAAIVRKIDVERWEQARGTVRTADREAIVVAMASGEELAAKRALSCLVAPERGDQVLVAWTRAAGGAAFLLAVLERPGREPVRLETSVDTELRVEGRLTLSATKALEATSAEQISLSSERLLVRAVDALATTGRLSLTTGRALLDAESVQSVLGVVDTVAERVLQRVKRAYRFVEQTEQVRAGGLDYRARETMSFHSENATLTADGLVKIDAEQVQLG